MIDYLIDYGSSFTILIRGLSLGRSVRPLPMGESHHDGSARFRYDTIGDSCSEPRTGEWTAVLVLALEMVVVSIAR